jgi:hypothetical protein
MKFRYELDGMGWATCTVEVAGKTATATASYCQTRSQISSRPAAGCAGHASRSYAFGDDESLAIAHKMASETNALGGSVLRWQFGPRCAAGRASM